MRAVRAVTEWAFRVPHLAVPAAIAVLFLAVMATAHGGGPQTAAAAPTPGGSAAASGSATTAAPTAAPTPTTAPTAPPRPSTRAALLTANAFGRAYFNRSLTPPARAAAVRDSATPPFRARLARLQPYPLPGAGPVTYRAVAVDINGARVIASRGGGSVYLILTPIGGGLLVDDAAPVTGA